MMKTKTHLRLLVLTLVFASATVWAAERAWQTGTWREAQTRRPKVVFGVAPNNPNSGAPRSAPPAAQEIRTYVIETDTLRLELKENTTVDASRIDVLIGQPVTFALEKNTVYVKDADGKEHKLSLTKKVESKK